MESKVGRAEAEKVSGQIGRRRWEGQKSRRGEGVRGDRDLIFKKDF